MMNASEKEMQVAEIKKEMNDQHLQEKLHEIIKAGGAIVAVNHALEEIYRIEDTDNEGEICFLSLVDSGSLENAIELLATLIQKNGNEVCRLLGFQSWS